MTNLQTLADDRDDYKNQNHHNDDDYDFQDEYDDCEDMNAVGNS